MIFLSLPVSAGNDNLFLRDSGFVYNGISYPLDEYHFLVDGNAADAVSSPSPFVFKTIQDAFSHLKDGTSDRPMVVYFAPDVYWVDDPDDQTVAVGKNGREPFGMVVKCNWLHLVGLSSDARDVVLASQRGQTQGAIGNFTMFDFWGDDLEVSNLTMGNFCNVDLVYPLNPLKNRQRRSSAITQAHVAYCHGDKTVARNVRFVSRLNMNPINGSKRVFYDDCHFECTDDAMTGNGLYLHCDFEFYGQKPFYTTHSTGAVLLDCDIYLKGESRDNYFCKQAGTLTLIDCRFHTMKMDVKVGWAPYPSPSLRCYQSNVKMNGKPLWVDGKYPSVTVNLEDKKLLQYYKLSEDVYNINGLLAGDDSWAPMDMTSIQDAQPFNTCLHVFSDQTAVKAGEAPVTFTSKQMRHSGYRAISESPVTWKVDSELEKYVQLDVRLDGSCQVSTVYDGDEPLSGCITASTDEGLQGAAVLVLKGCDLPAPGLKGRPKMVMKGDSVQLDYTLVPAGHLDQSDITWYLASDKKATDPIAVSVSHEKPQRCYFIKPEDGGKYLMAAVRPRHARSLFGEMKTVVYPIPLKTPQKENHSWMLETDFHDFPCQWQPLVKEGFWTVDGFKPADTADFSWSFDTSKPMWEYGEGFNGAVGKGLLQAQRGARIMYTPCDNDYDEMEVRLDVDPTKTAGQGFGSATGQYMDVCLKFDNRTLSGYGLRIIRTVKYAKAVDFYLVRYDQGQVTPLTEPVSAVCYRTGCHIVLKYADGRLSAQVHTDTPLSPPTDPVLQTSVSLSAAVPSSSYGGFCLQHTGSCGESTTMLHYLRIVYQ